MTGTMSRRLVLQLRQSSPLLAVTLALLPILLACTNPRAAAGDSPDMRVSDDDIAFSRLDAAAGEWLVAYVHVTNTGSLAGSATARLYLDTGGRWNGTLLGESSVTVASGGSAVASINVSLPAGVHSLTASIEDVVPEDPSPDDNLATTSLRIFPSPGLVDFSAPTLLLEDTRVTVRGGTERVIPMNVTVLGGRALNVTLRVLSTSGVLAEPVNQLDHVDPGLTVQVYLRISAPGSSEDSSPSERDLLVQAVASNSRGTVAVVSLLVHPPASSVSWWNAANVTLTAAGILGVILAGLHAVEPGRYKLLGLILPLYSKLRKEAVLDQYTRGRIHGYITANPGDNFGSIGRALGITGGNLAYHLRVLEREGQIISAMEGKRKRFYLKGAKVERANDPGLPAAQRTICRIVRETPDIKQKDIAVQLGVTSSTVSYHLQKLVARGIIEAKRRGMSVRYRLIGGKTELEPLDREEQSRQKLSRSSAAEKVRFAETQQLDS